MLGMERARQHFLTCPSQAGSPKLFLDYFFSPEA